MKQNFIKIRDHVLFVERYDKRVLVKRILTITL